MSRFFKSKFIIAAGVLGLAFQAHSALACAACFGRATGALPDGLNWGIFTLLGVIICVLGGIASFFVFLARRAASLAATTPGATKLEPTELNASTLKA